MGIKQLSNDNLRKLPNEYGDVSVMYLKNKIIFLSVYYLVHIATDTIYRYLHKAHRL